MPLPRCASAAWCNRLRKAFTKYLACGIFAHGFARARCGDCGHDGVPDFFGTRQQPCPYGLFHDGVLFTGQRALAREQLACRLAWQRDGKESIC